jgi:DNA polymerase-3 subunit gamma/tau
LCTVLKDELLYLACFLNYEQKGWMADSSYQVIARRWRPQQFSELVGQDHVVKTLGNAIELGRIAHAYLFVGPRGTGKTTSARLFAKSLNWEDGPSLDVPDDSEIGKAIMEGRCLDVIEIDGASNNSVDQVRDLRDECQYAPAQCRFKIYVIDEVHMLSQAAFNALLKTLEEPPPHVKFVFATTESHKVLPTIVSRCQRFEFRSIPVDLISLKLKEICAKENIEVEPPALEAIARMAMGGMRDAQSILDQMISFCGNSITQQNVLEVYGLVSADRIDSLARAILSADYGSILNETDAFSQEGLDFYRALQDLSDHFRQKLVLELSDVGNDSYPEQIVRILDALREGDELVRLGLSEKTNFEVTLFRAVESGKSRSIDQVIRKISKVLPEKELKKKTELTGITDHDSKVRAVDTKAISTPLESNLSDVIEKLPVDSISSVDPVAEEIVELSEIEKKETKDKGTEPKDDRQIQDESEISKRVERLPEKLRKSLVEDYKVNFVSIEKIDSSQLI